MSHPDISIRFIHNNQNKLHTSGNHNLKDIIYTVFGREIAGNLLPVSCEEEILQIRGFAGKPVIARSNRNFENYFINGRYVKSSLVAKAIEEAYKPFMMQHKYPFVLLHLRIEPEYLDVNVHPTKMELRFRDGDRIYQMIYRAVSDALAEKELIPQVRLDEKAEKEQQKAEWKAPHPEPFEVKRNAEMKNRESKGPVREIAGNGGKSGATPNQGIGGNPRYEYERRDTAQRAAEPILPWGGEVKMPESVMAKSAEPVKRPEMPRKVEELVKPKAAKPAEPMREPVRPVRTATQESAGEAARLSVQETSVPHQMDLFEEKLLKPESRSRHKLIGQLFDTYWLVEFNDQLYIIDQHAAHEKVLYEKTMRSLREREYTSQMVNPPIILTLGSEEQVLLEKHKKYFASIGFEIEPFGGNEYAVRAVPDNLFSVAKKDLLMEMLDGLSDDIFNGNPDSIYERVASMSCKAAVKGNMRMTSMEADHLIDELLGLENPYACPHGRPTIISMSKYELEKKFKRIV